MELLSVTAVETKFNRRNTRHKRLTAMLSGFSPSNPFFFKSEHDIHGFFTDLMLYMALPVFLFLHLVTPAPFGKHVQDTVGKRTFWSQCNNIQINAKIAWFLFESPNLIWSLVCFLQNRHTLLGEHKLREDNFTGRMNIFLLFMFVMHYINRAIIYPFRLNSSSHPVPLPVFISAMLYTTWNG